MITYILLFLAKFLDSFLQGSKSIAVHKRQTVKSAILGSVLMFLFLFIIDNVVSTDDIWSKIVVSVAAGIGLGFSVWLAKKNEKDKIWHYEIQCDSTNKACRLADELKANSIETTTIKGYLGENNKALFINATSHNKYESGIICDLVPIGSSIKVTQIIKQNK